MKTDEEFLKDRTDLFEQPGWLDLIAELNGIELSVRDIDTMRDEKDLWHAKGQLQTLGLLLSLESATRIAMDNLDN